MNIFHQALAFIVIEFILLILILFFLTAPKSVKTAQNLTDGRKSRNIVIGLFVLMLFCLVPAVSTIRVEQRWLQAPLATLLLILVYAYYNIQTRFKTAKSVLFTIFVLYFFVSDYYYYVGYRTRSYWHAAEGTAAIFKDACTRGTIRKQTQVIYILVADRVHFPTSALNWTLQDGSFFDYYEGNKKTIILIDSNMYEDKTQRPCIAGLHRETEQVIRWDGQSLSDSTDKIINERGRFLDKK